jgi:uncharacterized protein
VITVFLAVLFTILVALGVSHVYVWRRVVRDTTSPRTLARRVGGAAFIGLPVLSVGTIVGGRGGMPFWLEQVLVWPAYLWLPLFLYLLLALLAAEPVRVLLLRWAARRDAPAAGVPKAGAVPSAPPEPEPEREPPVLEPEPGRGSVALAEAPPPPAPGLPAAVSRRRFVSRVVGGVAGTVALGTVGYGAYGVFRGPRVKRLTVPLATLPRGGHGLRIAVVSDMHIGPVLGRGFAAHVVDTINATQPDVIAVVGDLVDGSVEDLGPSVAPLARLRARHGTYFVTGNHEYFSGAEQWIERVQELGMRHLANERTEMPGFDLAGVNDIRGESEGQGPDFAQALGDRDPSRTAVLLAHQPVVIGEAVRYGVDLQLSGHTHGGQLWPGPYVAGLLNPTVAGLERYGDTQLYVTRGAGAWGPPVRVGAPSDITVVELASK